MKIKCFICQVIILFGSDDQNGARIRLIQIDPQKQRSLSTTMTTRLASSTC